MKSALVVRNRQRTHRVNVPLLRRVAGAILAELRWMGKGGVGICLVDSGEMARLNETFLQHKGPTDVLAFDYTESGQEIAHGEERQAKGGSKSIPGDGEPLDGEIFICVPEAVAQARRFRATWPSEVTRYIIHGVLHLQGHDDLHSPARRRMKEAEERALRRIVRRFDLSQLPGRAGRARER